MKYTSDGERDISECNDSNIPVNSFLQPPDENDIPQWSWTADNFMPHTGRCNEAVYSIKADTKEDILEAVNKYLVPLYEAALKNLKEKGCCYYWGDE